VRFERGTRVRVVMSKWPDRPHWVFEGRYLGADHHGDWIGFPPGSRFTRPGADYVAPYAQVGLVPAQDLAERGWLATFHDPRGTVRAYVDVATPGTWDGTTLRSVDLDLDVVQGRSGRVWVDDEDEFADHRVRWDYPDEVVAQALASCATVEAAIRAGDAPWDAVTTGRWLDALGAASAGQ
jgi:uncharacterized protein